MLSVSVSMTINVVPLFKDVDMEKQGGKLMKVIGVAVTMLDKMDEFKPMLVKLGKRAWWCLDYILTRQSHRGRVSNMEVVPQPVRPVRADSDHNIVVATVDLGGRLAHNRPIRTNPKRRQFNRQDLQVEAARWAVSQRFLCNLLARSGAPATTTQEMAKEFTEALLGSAEEVSEEPRRRRTPEWNMTAAARAALATALDKRRSARHAFKARPNAATWRILKATCKGVKATIATSVYDQLEGYPRKTLVAKVHVTYGVTDNMYPSVVSALLITLEKGLGEECHQLTKDAWAWVMNSIAAVCIAAAREDTRAPAGGTKLPIKKNTAAAAVAVAVAVAVGVLVLWK
ncbi:unnamed protein product [Ectocarpus sp. CCAP 1310/34]|nr:unnamed protein product [Ectocarpus sp. CCAP 1310/34]